MNRQKSINTHMLTHTHLHTHTHTHTISQAQRNIQYNLIEFLRPCFQTKALSLCRVWTKKKNSWYLLYEHQNPEQRCVYVGASYVGPVFSKYTPFRRLMSRSFESGVVSYLQQGWGGWGHYYCVVCLVNFLGCLLLVILPVWSLCVCTGVLAQTSRYPAPLILCLETCPKYLHGPKFENVSAGAKSLPASSDGTKES